MAAVPPWKQTKAKRKAMKKHMSTSDVDVVAVPSTKQIAMASKGPPVADGSSYVTLRCAESGDDFIVPLFIASEFNLVKTALGSDGDYVEKATRTFTLHMVEAPALELILQHLFKTYLHCYDANAPDGLPMQPNRPGIVLNFPLQPELAVPVLRATNFLGLSFIMDISCQKISDYLEEIPSLDGLEDHLVMLILEQCRSPQQLLMSESRTDVYSRNLDTLPMWEKFYDRIFGQRHNNLNNLSLKNRRQAVIDHTVQKLSNELSADGVGAHVSFLARVGSNVSKHDLNEMCAKRLHQIGGVDVGSYVGYFNNLVNLSIVYFKLDSTKVASRVWQCIRHHSNLRKLSIEDAQLGDEAVVGLCEALTEQRKIEFLSLRQNNLTHEGLTSLLKVISRTKLRHLNFGGNHCTTFVVPVQAAESLRKSSLTTLVFDHNAGYADRKTNAKNVNWPSSNRFDETYVTSLNSNGPPIQTLLDNASSSSQVYTYWLSHLPHKLQRLSLGACNLVSSLTPALCEGIEAVHNTLHYLDIGENQLLNPRDLTLIAKALVNGRTHKCNLKHLGVAAVQWGVEGGNAVIRLLDAGVTSLDVSHAVFGRAGMVTEILRAMVDNTPSSITSTTDDPSTDPAPPSTSSTSSTSSTAAGTSTHVHEEWDESHECDVPISRQLHISRHHYGRQQGDTLSLLYQELADKGVVVHLK